MHEEGQGEREGREGGGTAPPVGDRGERECEEAAGRVESRRPAHVDAANRRVATPIISMAALGKTGGGTPQLRESGMDELDPQEGRPAVARHQTSARLVKQSELVVEQSQALASQSPAASDERQRTRGAGGVDVEGGRPQHLGALGGGGLLDG